MQSQQAKAQEQTHRVLPPKSNEGVEPAEPDIEKVTRDLGGGGGGGYQLIARWCCCDMSFGHVLAAKSWGVPLTPPPSEARMTTSARNDGGSVRKLCGRGQRTAVSGLIQRACGGTVGLGVGTPGQKEWNKKYGEGPSVRPSVRRARNEKYHKTLRAIHSCVAPHEDSTKLVGDIKGRSHLDHPAGIQILW